MKNYINSFDTDADVQSAVDNKELSKPYVAYIKDTDTVDFDTKDIDYASLYFTIEALEDGEFKVNSGGLSYSINGGDWTLMSAAGNITVSEGDEIRFKGNLQGSSSFFARNTLSFNVYGNALSLGYADDFKGRTNDILLRDSFFHCTHLVDASNLILPTSTRLFGLYNMFNGCTSLVNAPALPATTLYDNCYANMFNGCTSLVNAPELPATTLASNCYRYMFQGCTSLIKAPELPATTLYDYCYANMFQGCTSLTTAPELPALTVVNGCYYAMFSSCTSLTSAPELPALTVPEQAYFDMFARSTVNYVKCLATTLTGWEPTGDWLYSVSSTGTFVKNPNMTSWTTGSSGIPNGWTVVDAE